MSSGPEPGLSAVIKCCNLTEARFGLPRAGSLLLGLEVLIYPGLSFKMTEKL